MDWVIEPGAVAWVLTAEALWLRAARVLARRGWRVPAWQTASWHAGVALWVGGLLSPIHAAGEQGLAPHMVQHLLIADLAAPLLLIGLRSPVLVHFLPRSVLVPLARSRLRGLFRTLRRPLVAIPVYALVLYGWHFSFAFDAAVRSPVVHTLQHGSFIGAGMLVWWSALEPKRRRTPGELWKIGHLLGARMLGMMLGMSFVLIRTPIYTDVYGRGDRAWGLDPIADQQIAGAAMVVTDICLMMIALAFFFFRSGQDYDRREAAAREGTGDVAPALSGAPATARDALRLERRA